MPTKVDRLNTIEGKRKKLIEPWVQETLPKDADQERREKSSKNRKDTENRDHGL